MISADITSQIAFLQGQVTAAAPLANATHATKEALKLNAAQLVASVEATLVAKGNTLDVWEAPADPASIALGVLGLVSAAVDQNALSLMRGVFGRAASNLDQL
jgi:hypothetical protein